MTAPVVPIKPEPEPARSDDEGWALLEGLKRRLDDQAVAQRATQTQVTQLAESIGALVELQRRRVRSLNLNSFVAYVIFTVLVGGGAYLLFRSRATELVDARERAGSERDAAVKRGDEATAKLAARDAAEAKAFEAFQLLETGKRADAKAKLAALAGLPLSRTERAVLDARAKESQVAEVEGALKSAAAAFKAGRYGDVVAPLEAALVVEPSGPRVAQMKYFLGVAYSKAGDLDKAIAMLTAVGDDTEDARFQLASALDRKGEFAKARGEYDRFATAHPQSQLAVFAMRRSATLAHAPAVAPVAPKAVVPAQPAPAVPQPKPVLAPPAAVKQPEPESGRGEAMSTTIELPMAPVDDADLLAVNPRAVRKKKAEPAHPSPSEPVRPSPPVAGEPVRPPQDVPCTGSCVPVAPQPPKAAPMPSPSPWLPPSMPDKPEPAPAPGPSPTQPIEPRPLFD